MEVRAELFSFFFFFCICLFSPASSQLAQTEPSAMASGCQAPVATAAPRLPCAMLVCRHAGYECDFADAMQRRARCGAGALKRYMVCAAQNHVRVAEVGRWGGSSKSMFTACVRVCALADKAGSAFARERRVRLRG